MKPLPTHPRSRRPLPGRTAGGFTLTELLVAIGVIALLSTLTLVSIKTLSRDARLSSGRNAVVVALGNARSLAMKNSRLTAAVFRVNWDPNNPSQPQFTEIYLAEWSGTSLPFGASGRDLADVFVPVRGVRTVPLPRGIKVAGPSYDAGADATWITQPELAKTHATGVSEGKGRMLAVMFAPDGTLVTRNPAGSGENNVAFVNFNYSATTPIIQDIGATTGAAQYWEYDEADDEPNLEFCPFLGIYDDQLARETKGDDDWSDSMGPGANPPAYVQELQDDATGFIGKYSDRIHFNRYTGVVTK